ncbi:MAG: ATP-binding domain-containing protein [Idiomarina sp.]|nr:ATP-binding domain-containing protein [Idiomarina sp.]
MLIDEMQDYTPLQYSVLNRLFGCRKTILGDASQSLNPYGSSTAVQIHELMEAARLVELNKSYRCSWEIMQYALGVQPNDKLVAMERHGKEPETIHCASLTKLDETVKQQIESFKNTQLNTMAIICKTQKQANRLHNALAKNSLDVRLINQDSLSFDANVLICTATMSKGLEFDKVIVVDASAKNYGDELDRNLLYVACTRAMHELVVTYTGAPSHLLPE